MPAFEPGALLLSIVTSGVGVALFVYGKKTLRVPHMIAGVLFVIYPYFVSTTLMTAVVGVALALALWAAIWLGW